MVLLIIIPMKNGYFIGNINPTFSDKPICSYSIYQRPVEWIRARRCRIRMCHFIGSSRASWCRCPSVGSAKLAQLVVFVGPDSFFRESIRTAAGGLCQDFARWFSPKLAADQESGQPFQRYGEYESANLRFKVTDLWKSKWSRWKSRFHELSIFVYIPQDFSLWLQGGDFVTHTGAGGESIYGKKFKALGDHLPLHIIRLQR